MFIFLVIFNKKKINFFTDFDGYYIVRTDEGQPRPKYIFKKCGTKKKMLFGPSLSPNFKKKTCLFRLITSSEQGQGLKQFNKVVCQGF